MSMPKTNKNMKVVWGAIERRGSTLWSRIGLAWESKDGALFAHLSSIPLSGRICIRERAADVPEMAPLAEEALR